MSIEVPNVEDDFTNFFLMVCDSDSELYHQCMIIAECELVDESDEAMASFNAGSKIRRYVEGEFESVEQSAKVFLVVKQMFHLSLDQVNFYQVGLHYVMKMRDRREKQLKYG